MIKSIHSPQGKLLVNWLADKRKQAQLSQRALAERLDVVHSFVARVELGERRLDTVELVIYCEAIAADPCEIIERLKTV